MIKEKRQGKTLAAACSVLDVIGDNGQNDSQNYKDDHTDLGVKSKLAFHRLSLLLAKESLRTAGDGTGQTCSLTGLKKNQHDQTKANNTHNYGEVYS